MKKIKDNSKAIKEAEDRRDAIMHELQTIWDKLNELHAAEYGVKIGSRVSFQMIDEKFGAGTVVELDRLRCYVKADKSDGTPGTLRRIVYYFDIINVIK